ncbi:heterokaryon incompatibility 6 OR allele, partial [Fusarium mundagurra]
MSSTKQPSRYQALSDGEIRILRLFAGAEGDLLKGEFIKRQLSASGVNDTQALQYDALSYVWGGEPNPNDGRLRLPSQSRILWIDALCINQSDLGELGNQVGLMPKIYSSARHVLVDLGPETDDSHRALKLLNLAWNKNIWSAILSQSGWTPEDIAHWVGVDLPSEEERMKSQMITLPSPEDKQWDSVVQFFCRPWFSRLWIIQEFIMARELRLFHGTQQVKWQELFAAAHDSNAQSHGNDLASTRGFLAYFFMGSIRRFRELSKTPEGVDLLARHSSSFVLRRLDKIQLSDLVHFFQSSQSKRKRDRYFALVGIADDVGNEKKLQPDYKSSLDDIVTRFGEVMIEKDQGGEVLLRAGLWQQHSSSVPSWIPDYARQEDVLNLIQPRTFGPSYAAAGNSNYHVSTLKERKDTIVLRGAFIDVVDQKAFASSLDNAGVANSFGDLLEHHSMSLRALIEPTTQSCYLQTGEPILDAVAATLICGLRKWEDVRRMRVGFNCYSWMAVARNRQTVQANQWIYTRITKHFGVEWNDIHPQLTEYTERANLVGLSRLQPARTRRGYFANLPRCFEPGDQIWVMQGVAMPLVLRKSNTDRDCFQLV